MIGKSKQQDLADLSRFIAKKEIHGWVSNFWFHCLRQAYPFEFIQLARAHKLCSNDPEINKRLDLFIPAAVKDLNESLNRFNNFLVRTSDDPAELVQFNDLVRKLEGFILKQNLEN